MKKNESGVTVSLDKQNAKNSENLVVYVTGKNGAIVESAPLRSGEAKLKTSSAQLKNDLRLFVISKPPKEIEGFELNEQRLIKAGAWQPGIHIRDGLIQLPLLPDFEWWPFRFCFIKGNVSKEFIIDGHPEVRPICHARVHICEVDPIWIIWPKIPDQIIIKLRDSILNSHIRLPHFPDTPIVVPPIGPDPSPEDFVSSELLITNKRSFRSKQPRFSPLPKEVLESLQVDSADLLRINMQRHIHLLHPFICMWPHFWPFFYRCDHIRTLETDCNGNFSTNYFYFNTGDKPDIYVWIEVYINGQWVTVYRPSKACGTRWNYVCGSDINIRITDPRVGLCDCHELEGDYIWMKSVNTNTSIRRVQQNNAASAQIANARGLTDFEGRGNISPFGASFPLVVQFGSGYPQGNVTHYRWKYTRLTDASLTPVPFNENIMEGQVGKTYLYPVTSGGNTVVARGSFDMGPNYVNAKAQYKIPHSEAALDVPAIPTAEYEESRTRSIQTNTVGMENGLYEFTFELLNTAGNVVGINPSNYLVDLMNPPALGIVTEPAAGLPENYLILQGGQAVGFRFVIRIDNQVCYADVLDAVVDGTSSDSVCGVGEYSNKATSNCQLRFLAGHPQDFAHYNFHVTKGNSNNLAIANSENLAGLAQNGYSRTTLIIGGAERDRFAKNIAVNDMLGACTMAAFAENLHVRASHTNGNVRLENYDRSDTAALALAPDTP
jgi:hypothetical protein